MAPFLPPSLSPCRNTLITSMRCGPTIAQALMRCTRGLPVLIAFSITSHILWRSNASKFGSLAAERRFCRFVHFKCWLLWPLRWELKEIWRVINREIAQMVEWVPIDRKILCSNPSEGVFFSLKEKNNFCVASRTGFEQPCWKRLSDIL